MRQFVDNHFPSLLGVTLIALGALLVIKDGSPHSYDLGEKLLACGLLAVNVGQPGANPK